MGQSGICVRHAFCSLERPYCVWLGGCWVATLTALEAGVLAGTSFLPKAT